MFHFIYKLLMYILQVDGLVWFVVRILPKRVQKSSSRSMFECESNLCKPSRNHQLTWDHMNDGFLSAGVGKAPFFLSLR